MYLYTAICIFIILISVYLGVKSCINVFSGEVAETV